MAENLKFSVQSLFTGTSWMYRQCEKEIALINTYKSAYYQEPTIEKAEKYLTMIGDSHLSLTLIDNISDDNILDYVRAIQDIETTYDDETLDTSLGKALENCADVTCNFDIISLICDVTDRLYRKHASKNLGETYLRILCRYIKTAEKIGDIAKIQIIANKLIKEHPGTDSIYCTLVLNVEKIRIVSDISILQTSFQNLEELFELETVPEFDKNTIAEEYLLGCSYASEIDGIDLNDILNKAYEIAEQYDLINNPYLMMLAYNTFVKTSSRESLYILKKSYYVNVKISFRKNVSYLSLSPYLVPYICDSPDIVYHYTDLNAMKSIIENNTFWATNHRFLNDTEEKKYIETVLSMLKEKKDLAELCKTYETVIAYVLGTHQFSENGKQEETERYASDAYIISFSVNGDSLTLWSEYAKKSGINIGIDCKKLRKDIIYDTSGVHEDVFGGRVIYIDSQNAHDPNLLKIINMIDEIMSDCITYEIPDDIRDGIIESHLIYLSNFIKHRSMVAEDEYRLVYFPKNDCETKIRIKDEILIPYIEYKDEINSAITSITVSPVNKNHLTLEGIKYLLDKYKIHSCISVDNNASKENEVKINQSQITLRY